MHRILQSTWSFRTQLGVFTLATAVASALGTWLISCPTPANPAHPLFLAGLIGMAGLACGLLGSLLQQGKHQVLEQTRSLLQGQAAHIAERTSAIDELAADAIELAASIRRAAESARGFATVPEDVLRHIQHGTMVLAGTCQGLQDMSTKGRDVARRLQHLGEHSQEVEKIGQRIGERAERMHVLALNVSIQATKTGAMGQACMAAAAEVEHLSGRTTEETRRIAYLAHAMRRQIHEVALALEESTGEMAQWVQAAAQAGCSLQEIESVSSPLAGLLPSLVRETEQQTRAAGTLSKAISEQSAATHQALVDTQRMVTALDDLLPLANR